VIKDAFVIMPFSATPTCTEAQWTETYDYVFRPAFLEAGYGCERAKPMVGHVLSSIIDSLRGCRIVLADITDRNPNVFYELGIRHTLKKGTIIVSRDEKVPSDLGGMWYVRYENSPAGVAKFKNEIKRLTQEIEQKPDRTDNPVMEYLDREKLSVSGFVNRENVKKLSALYTELTGNLVVLYGGIKRGQRLDFASYGCLDLLCNTMYLDLGPELLASAFELRNRLKRLEGLQEVSIPDIVERIVQFLTKIDEVRKAIGKGEYVEPSSVSLMTWSASPGSNPLTTPCESLFLNSSICSPTESDLNSRMDLTSKGITPTAGIPEHRLETPERGRNKKEPR
jgi:hypothetical protein